MINSNVECRLSLRTFARAAAIVAMIGISGHAFAAVTAQEAASLKTTLTPLGAERAGSKDGTIPAWTGVEVKGGGGGEWSAL